MPGKQQGMLRLAGVVMVLSSLLVTGCSSTTYKSNPSLGFDPTNACSILDANPGWKRTLDKNYKRWGVPPHVTMAIIRQESAFRADARPIKNGKRLSSAYGYPQALNAVWSEYRQERGGRWATRDDFHDAVDFIGWYSDKNKRLNGVSGWDPRNLYLAYHEGWGGFGRKTYLKKPWLMKVAGKVEDNAWIYSKQIKKCG